jgi:hypothetical protein
MIFERPGQDYCLIIEAVSMHPISLLFGRGGFGHEKPQKKAANS